MKKLISLCAITFFALASYAQSSNYEDVVYLKNGSIYRGMIIEQVPNKSLKIQSQDRNVFAVDLSDVEKITKEEKPNNFYRNRHFENRMDEKPQLDDAKSERKRKPTKLGGFYLNWGLGVAGTSQNQGAAFEMGLGGKIFSPKVKETNKKVSVGADVFGFIGGIGGSGMSSNVGLNVGPTVAFRLKKNSGNIYLTPYLGVNVSSGRTYDEYYDYYGGYYYGGSYRYINVTAPVGLKFEYNYKHFITGLNASLGLGVDRVDNGYSGYDMGAAGRLMLFVGVKF